MASAGRAAPVRGKRSAPLRYGPDFPEKGLSETHLTEASSSTEQPLPVGVS